MTPGTEVQQEELEVVRHAKRATSGENYLTCLDGGT